MKRKDETWTQEEKEPLQVLLEKIPSMMKIHLPTSLNNKDIFINIAHIIYAQG